MPSIHPSGIIKIKKKCKNSVLDADDQPNQALIACRLFSLSLSGHTPHHTTPQHTILHSPLSSFFSSSIFVHSGKSIHLPSLLDPAFASSFYFILHSLAPNIHYAHRFLNHLLFFFFFLHFLIRRCFGCFLLVLLYVPGLARKLVRLLLSILKSVSGCYYSQLGRWWFFPYLDLNTVVLQLCYQVNFKIDLQFKLNYVPPSLLYLKKKKAIYIYIYINCVWCYNIGLILQRKD